ncbi:MAG: hypothetical protein AABP62_15510 [Planctomycetota bacterium]
MNTEPHSFKWDFPDDLYSLPVSRGLYSPLQFVVRLRKDLHDLLATSTQSFVKGKDVDSQLFWAFSTFFHETIHWWQHVGSTTGLMLSFAYPAQSHINHTHLIELLRTLGPRKSLKTVLLDMDAYLSEEQRHHLNTILNNWHDIEFNRRIILDPNRLDEVVHSPFFDSIGHSLSVGLGNTLVLLSSTIDPRLTFLPNFKAWDDEFERLRSSKTRGFFFGSDIHRVPLGARSIFEGQARFCQLQYLHLATGGELGWDDFKQKGMLNGIYTDAFQKFLKWAELEWPVYPTDSTVQLFLLICDLAINPCDGYPFDIAHFESFVESNDPSFRFMWFCRQVAQNPSIRRAVTKCSAAEYLELSTILCRSITCRQPVEMSQEIHSWSQKSEELQKLLREDETFEFGNENLPVRVFFARHLRFVEDRIQHPEFFCWPAMYMVENPSNHIDLAEAKRLFDRHRSLFVADLDGEIRPSLFDGRTEAKIYQTFNNFYSWNVIYDMVRQWTVNDGPFHYDFSWLTPKYSTDQMKSWVDGHFKHVFKVAPNDFHFFGT